MKYLLFLFFSFVKSWEIIQKKLYHQNEVFKIRGLNWYGFETKSQCIEGLWENPLDWYFDHLKINQINALRIPISEQMILYDNKPLSIDIVKKEIKAYEKTSLEVLDLFMEVARDYKIAILLDIHRLKPGLTTPLWYIPNNENYTEDSLIRTIQFMVERYKVYPNFMGIDIFNEPHYYATWSNETNSSVNWKGMVERVVNQIFNEYPNESFLLFVNGIDWGKNLSLWNTFPLEISYPNRIVASPHLYGPGITHIPDFSKDYLFSLWDDLFGNIDHYICVGEFGTRFDDEKGYLWIQRFAEYMQDREFTDNFFWSLNPYSKDVDGLMNNWTDWNQTRIEFLKMIQPFPTNLEYF